jgi:hypothetical protein
MLPDSLFRVPRLCGMTLSGIGADQSCKAPSGLPEERQRAISGSWV